MNAIGRATAVSYNRPIITNTSPIGGTHDFIFGVEHSAIRWLEQNGYDVSYISGVDTTRSGSLLLNHDAFLSVGHDEYWSAEQRANVEAARDAGVNLAFWSGNEIYWKVRWETSIDGNGTPYRTMVCYKETWGGTPDPSDIGTGTWRDPRFADPGQEPENSLTGTMFTGGQLPARHHHHPLRLFEPPLLAQHRRRRSAAGPDPFAGARTCSAMNGTPTSKTASGRPA